jgi:hypothetical protein
LIQLHTTTAETINLQEVRASDSDGGGLNIADDDSEDDDDRSSKLVLQEKRTDKTGWRTISIRPALYEAVGEWNTPSSVRDYQLKYVPILWNRIVDS